MDAPEQGIQDSNIVKEFAQWLTQIMRNNIRPLPFPVLSSYFRLRNPCLNCECGQSQHFHKYLESINMTVEKYLNLNEQAKKKVHSKYYWNTIRSAKEANRMCNSQLFLSTLLADHSGMSIAGRQLAAKQGNGIGTSTYYDIRRRYYRQSVTRIESEHVTAVAVTYWFDNLVKRWKRNYRLNANESLRNPAGDSRPYPIRSSTAIGCNIVRGQQEVTVPVVGERPFLTRAIFGNKRIYREVRNIRGDLFEDFSLWTEEVGSGAFVPRVLFEQSTSRSEEEPRVGLNNFLPLSVSPYRPDNLYGNLQSIKHILDVHKKRTESKGKKV